MAGIAASTEQVKIQYVGAPRYRVVVEAVDYKTAEEDMKLVTATVVDTLNSSGGKAAFHRDAK